MSLNASFGPPRACIRPSARFITVRHASLNSAIDRGIRRSRGFEGSPSPRNSKNDDASHRGKKGRKDDGDFDTDAFIKTGKFQALPREFQGRNAERQKGDMNEPEPKQKKPSKYYHPKAIDKSHRPSDKVPERIKRHVMVPSSIPYTTPASEFIYGTNAVEAALRCRRRQLYKLYIYQAADEELSPAKISIRKMALLNNVLVKMAFAEWDKLLDKMSAGRPHNGCILEASPLPQLPVKSLRAVSSPNEDTFRVELGAQSREEAATNGLNDRIKIHQPQSQQRRRYPVTLLLDGVVDTGNLGAIIRSAYYLGIDAIIFAGRNSAPLSPVTIKSSAGAAENMPLLTASNEQGFIQRSKENGWRFYAADAPGPGSNLLDDLSDADSSGGNSRNALIQSPSVIMMGSESNGLSRHIKSYADATVSIPGARFSGGMGVESDPARIDSLNVSVASALLMEMFLRVPLEVTK